MLSLYNSATILDPRSEKQINWPYTHPGLPPCTYFASPEIPQPVPVSLFPIRPWAPFILFPCLSLAFKAQPSGLSDPSLLVIYSNHALPLLFFFISVCKHVQIILQPPPGPANSFLHPAGLSCHHSFSLFTFFYIIYKRLLLSFTSSFLYTGSCPEADLSI